MAVQPVSLQGKKILVTGPTSQVALPLLKQLCPIADVHALARFSRQKDMDKISALGATIIRKDLATDALDDIPTDFDYVLHFAVVKSGDFEYDLKANAIGSGRLLAHCKQAKAFLQCSTTGVYQYAGQNPLAENAALGDNHRALLPTYSICKIAQETVVRFAAQEHGVPLTIARLSVPYGDNGGWPYWHMVMMQNGAPVTVHPEQPNSYTPLHADDYCRHIPYLLGAATPETTIVNWGGGQVVSIEEWCAWISELTGFTATFDLQSSAFGSLVADIGKLKDILGDQPVSQVDWKDGILRMMRKMAPQHLKAEYAQEANTGS